MFLSICILLWTYLMNQTSVDNLAIKSKNEKNNLIEQNWHVVTFKFKFCKPEVVKSRDLENKVSIRSDFMKIPGLGQIFKDLWECGLIQNKCIQMVVWCAMPCMSLAWWRQTGMSCKLWPPWLCFGWEKKLTQIMRSSAVVCICSMILFVVFVQEKNDFRFLNESFCDLISLSLSLSLSLCIYISII